MLNPSLWTRYLKAQQDAVNKTLKANNLPLVATFQIFEKNDTNHTDKGQANFEIDFSTLKNFHISSLKLWRINLENTMEEVLFEDINGKIIFNHDELGAYVLTA